ncbi:hypothetical protein Tco_1265982 [Tanacetum coccineum]
MEHSSISTHTTMRPSWNDDERSLANFRAPRAKLNSPHYRGMPLSISQRKILREPLTGQHYGQRLWRGHVLAKG